MGDLKALIDTGVTNTATNTSDIATNTTNVATNAGEISTNAATIVSNAADIAAFTPNLPVVVKATALAEVSPPAGKIIYVDESPGPVLCFSNGTEYLLCSTLAALS
jgi:predicted secreted protein